jgi:hypothetical protein
MQATNSDVRRVIGPAANRVLNIWTTIWTSIRFRALGVCFVVFLLGSIFTGASALASTGYVDGISDQSLPRWDSGFSSSYFAGFFKNNWINPSPHIQYARYVVQWNVMYKPTEKPYNEEPYNNYRQQFEEWLTDAGGMGLTLEIALTEYPSTPYPSSSSEYKSRLKEVLNQANAQGHPVSYLEPWNEPNGQGGESASAAAHFANEGNVACKESPKCTIVAGNFEDSSSAANYIKEYRENLNFTPSNWGIHPYQSVEHEEEKYYNNALEALPNKGEGDHIWFTEIAVRRCTASNNNGEMGQAERAKWLVDTLMSYAKPEHVFYWEFLLKEHKQPACSETDDALYVPSSDPNAPDAPRSAAAFIYGGSGFPWGYTGSPTITNSEQATMAGSVYPGGILIAKYHFEYGTTTSYGSYSSEGSAGSGTGGVGESATISGLTEDTTYHYRLVAWNSAGSDYGADATLTTPRRPTVITETATGVGQTAATFRGTVNPNAAETHYYFQYGTSTSYGSNTPEPPGNNAGSGTTSSPESTIATNLEPGTTYHYRVVASSWAGTSYGNDQTFTTEMLTTPDSAVRDSRTGNEWYFYVNGSGGIEGWAWTAAAGWQPIPLNGGSQAATGTNPIVVRNQQTGFMALYYIANNGQIWNYNTSNTTGMSGWTSHALNGSGATAAQGTSPSVVYNPNTGSTGVYYVATNGQIWAYQSTSETSWTSFEWGGGGPAAAANTSPSAVYNPSNGFTAIYYVATSGQIWADNWTAETGRTAFEWGGGGAPAAANSSPSAVYNPSNGYTAIYYISTNGQMWADNWTAETGRTAVVLSGGGAPAAANTSPTAVYNQSNGSTGVYYVGPNGQMWAYQSTSKTSWTAFIWSGGGAAPAAGITPSAVYSPNTGYTAVYYRGPNEQMWNYEWSTETGFIASQLCVGGEGGEEPASAPSTSNSAVRDPRTGDEWDFYVNSSGGIGGWAWTAAAGWQPISLSGGSQAATGTNPIVVRNEQTGFMAVYYAAKNGQIWNYNTNNATGMSGWTSYALSGGGKTAAQGASPSVVYNPNTGSTGVYYVATNGQIWAYEWTSETSWVSFEWGGGGAPAAANSSPSAVYNPSNGFTAIYYISTNGQMWADNWTAEGGMTSFAWGGGGAPAAADTSPSAVYNPATGFTAVYYVGPSGKLWNYNWTAETGMTAYALSGGASAAANTSPTTVYNQSNGSTGVYYVSSNGQVWAYEWTSKTSWTSFAWGGSGATPVAGITPSAVYGPTTGYTAIYYQGPNEQQWTYNWTPTTGMTAHPL